MLVYENYIKVTFQPVMTNRKEKNSLLMFSQLHLPVLVTHL